MLNNKTELEKAFAKHKKNLDEKRKEQESTDAFTDEFKKMIAERAKRLEKGQSSDYFFVQSMIYWHFFLNFSLKKNRKRKQKN